MSRTLWWRVLVASFGVLISLNGATSTAWESSGFTELLKGRLKGLSLTADGVLTAGPAQRWNTALGQPALWSMALAPDGSIYAATGHSGRVFRIEPNGKATQIWASEQAEVFAIALDSKGHLYAGTSPNGGIYRISEGRVDLVWKSPVKYIWNLALLPDGAIFAGTGESGRIYKIDPSGHSAVYYDTEQGNVTALAIGTGGHIYAGTEPNGIVYDIDGPNKGTVLYDSTLPEIRSIVPAADGGIYVAAMGGAVSTRTGGAPASTANSATSGVVTATSPTVITVTEAHQSQEAQAGSRPSVTSSVVTPAANAASSTALSEVAGVEKSAVYKIAPDHTVETIRSSKQDNVYDLALASGSVLVSTDDNGRVYEMSGSRVTLLVEPGDGETTRILRNEHHLYLALSNPARVIAFDSDEHGAGNYESQVHDSGAVARWGHLQWRATGGPGLKFQTRTGNSVRPDATWSDWSTAIRDSQHGLISSPVARFIQWRGEWDAGSTTGCTSVTLPYLPQNGAPTVRSISASSILGTNPAKAAAGAAASSSAYSVTVTDTGEAPAATTTSGAGQTVSHLQTTQTQVTWQADDPDSDKLVYALYFRPEEAHEWQLIRSRMAENTLLLDPDVFADGRYLFRVVASDAPSNAPQYAKQNELVSSPVLVDNTPPVLTISKPRRNGSVVDVDFSAADATSPLKRCEYSLDGNYWQPIEALDGITDTPFEQFSVHLEKLRPGEHLIVFRVFDTAGNAGLGRVLVP